MPLNQPSKTVLFIGYVWPEPLSSAAGFRTWGLIEYFQKMGWRVVFTSSARKTHFSNDLEQAGIPIFSSSLNDSSWDLKIQELQPQAVVFDRFVTEEQFGWRVQASCPNALRILDTQDLHFLRKTRQRKEALTACLNEDAKREFASIYRCDLTLILSSFEYELLTQEYGISRELLLWLPFFYSLPAPATPSFKERAQFCMIGNFRHLPNADAVFWLHEKIWPAIRKILPHSEVHLYGAYPPRKIMELDQPDQGFRVFGPIPGPRDRLWQMLSRYRVNLAPLRFGAGIKGKISDGWLSGTPALSTPIGAEGMSDGAEWGGLIASLDDSEALAKQAAQLHEDPILWHKAQSRGYELLKILFDWDHHFRSFSSTLLILEAEYEQRRTQNTIGQILWHQSLRSTEYFSRWIELKNSIHRDLTEPSEPGIQRDSCALLSNSPASLPS